MAAGVSTAQAIPKVPGYGTAPNGSILDKAVKRTPNPTGLKRPAGHPVTREWLRCSVGQTWNGKTCTGEALQLSLPEARQVVSDFNKTGYQGKKDWRLPTIYELASLRLCNAGDFAIYAGVSPKIYLLTHGPSGVVVGADGNIDKSLYIADACKNFTASSNNPQIDSKAFPNLPRYLPGYHGNPLFREYYWTYLSSSTGIAGISPYWLHTITFENGMYNHTLVPSRDWNFSKHYIRLVR